MATAPVRQQVAARNHQTDDIQKTKTKSMEPRIEFLQGKKLIGNYLEMSMVNNKTGALWGQFAPRIKEIQNRSSSDKISLQIYDASFFKAFNPCNFT